MIQKRNFAYLPLATLLMSALLVSFAARATVSAEEAQVASTCSVPVCDISKEIETYRGLRQGLRYDEMNKLLATYKRSTDLAILKNLADFAGALEALYTEIKEDDWMIRSAQGFRAEMLLSLAKYSDLNADVLAGYFTQIKGEASRFAVVSYWRERIREFEDKKSLLDLMEFFNRIGKISHDDQDPEYIATSAKECENVITTRIVQLYPYFEGSYKISVVCDEADVGGSLGRYCDNDYLNRLVVMDPLQGGIQISLSNRESGQQLFAFQNVVLSEAGSQFRAVGSPSGVPSQIELSLDKATGKISGWIRNADSLSALKIQGIREESPAAVYDLSASVAGKSVVSVEQVARIYEGMLSDKKVTLTLSSFGDGHFAGTMAFEGVRYYRIRFQLSRFYPKLGVLVLVGAQPGGSNLKLTLFFQASGDSMVASGMAFSDLNGAVHQVSLQSVK